MNRLNQLSGQVQKSGTPKYLKDPLDFLRLKELLTPEEENLRLRVREYTTNEAEGKILPYVESASFPEDILLKSRPYKIMENLIGKPYGQNDSYVKAGLIMMELGRIDPGLCTAFAVQSALLGYTLDRLGSEEQKERYLSKVINLELIGGWGLTERDIGSDASNLQTTARKVEGGYVLNGNKRWIGNGNKDILIIWARNMESKQVEGFIVENKWKGVTSEVIKNKLAMRVVQNCQIELQDVFVPEANKLSKCKDFQTGTNVILGHSRVLIPWMGVAIQLGVYENVVKYISERKQFGKPLSSFQLQQERLVRIINNLQSSFLLALRVARLADEHKTTIGAISSIKAFVSERTREVARLGREMMGGNGIISDNYCMRAVADAEVVYTYEGTYDINSLVAGRELTGVSAFVGK